MGDKMRKKEKKKNRGIDSLMDFFFRGGEGKGSGLSRA